MINPLKFIQGVKNEAFRVSWPTGKETLTGAVMVVLLAIVAAIFFLISSEVSNVEPLIRWVDGLTTDFVEIFIEFSIVRSF